MYCTPSVSDHKPKFCSRICVRCADARSAGVFGQNAGAPVGCVEALDGSPMSSMIGSDDVKSNANFGINDQSKHYQLVDVSSRFFATKFGMKTCVCKGGRRSPSGITFFDGKETLSFFASGT